MAVSGHGAVGEAPGLVQRGEDRAQPAVERSVEFQHRDVLPGVQRVVVDQFYQRVVHLRSEPGHLRCRQDMLRLWRDHRDGQQVEARESRLERCGAGLISGVRPGRACYEVLTR